LSNNTNSFRLFYQSDISWTDGQVCRVKFQLLTFAASQGTMGKETGGMSQGIRRVLFVGKIDAVDIVYPMLILLPLRPVGLHGRR
jgi:hypothetical protein